MAQIGVTFPYATSEYRICTVDDKKALFHCWEVYSNVVAESSLIGGHPAGQVSYILGIVEYEDGTIDSVFPNSIKFCDGRVISEWSSQANTLTKE